MIDADEFMHTAGGDLAEAASHRTCGVEWGSVNAAVALSEHAPGSIVVVECCVIMK